MNTVKCFKILIKKKKLQLQLIICREFLRFKQYTRINYSAKIYVQKMGK